MVNPWQLSFCFSFVLVLGTGALAEQTQQSGAAKSSRSVQEPASRTPDANVTGSADQDCKFRTHNCEACTEENGKVTCSSIGIACEPTEWRCLDLQAPEK